MVIVRPNFRLLVALFVSSSTMLSLNVAAPGTLVAEAAAKTDTNDMIGPGINLRADEEDAKMNEDLLCSNSRATHRRAADKNKRIAIASKAGRVKRKTRGRLAVSNQHPGGKKSITNNLILNVSGPGQG